ncbi:Protein of unknown function [Pyronema omphalodes CBS 100304]|uniref:Uncharacterized protein n=1 Tax=Pyronema omphalodes (strain CBS 100304) TaxID=1076935 RepID=U4KY26_PYROM|nr:Protein of unknown function [Pyronema omphalodes CBS 100304]
MIGCQRVTW